jgi:hypothetical protein
MDEYRAAGATHFELKFYCRSLEHMREQLGLLAEHSLAVAGAAGVR